MMMGTMTVAASAYHADYLDSENDYFDVTVTGTIAATSKVRFDLTYYLLDEFIIYIFYIFNILLLLKNVKYYLKVSKIPL